MNENLTYDVVKAIEGALNNLAGRVTLLEKYPVVSENVKNAMIKDFDNLFVRVQELENKAVKNIQADNESALLISKQREEIKILTEKLAHWEKNSKFWQAEALESRVKRVDLRGQVSELIKRLDQARKERDLLESQKKDVIGLYNKLYNDYNTLAQKGVR